MITPQTVLVRTAAGSALLQTSDSDLSRTERLLLIMVNGQVTVGEISNKLYSIPLRRLIEALDYLTGRNLVSSDKKQDTVPSALKRHELEAFLRTDELDPTTAMIANFELQAALNDSAHASVIVDQGKEGQEKLDQKIREKLQKAPAVENTRPVVQAPIAATQSVSIIQANTATPIRRVATAPVARKMQMKKKQSVTPFILLALFAVVWVAVIWYVRHR